MKNLWTPWRMEHVTGEAEPLTGCLFEPSVTAPFDKERLILLKSDHVIILLNRFPYTNGHLLVAPEKHVPCLTDLSPDESAYLMNMVRASTRILKTVLAPDGFNIGLNIGEHAGAGIADHLHFHIVPRWKGDHNFITVLGEIRTIPEHLEKTFDKLLPSFKDLHNTLNT